MNPHRRKLGGRNADRRISTIFVSTNYIIGDLAFDDDYFADLPFDELVLDDLYFRRFLSQL